jgi:serine protease
MRRRLLAGACALALGCALTGTAAGPASAGAHITGRLHAPHPLVPRPRGGHALAIAGAMTNHGGPVQTAPKVYVVFWDWTSDPSGEQAYLTRFLSSVGGTPWLGTVNQFGAGSQASLLAGTWSDTADAVPASPTDAQIQAEAARAVTHFGTGGSVNVQIVVATPTGHSTSGFGTSFCAYHGAVGADPNVTYTDLPYMTDAGGSCGEDSVNGAGGLLDGVSIVEGHELAEAITDPLLNAWFDANGAEIGDKCAWTGLGNITTSAGTFAVQPLWSNVYGCALTSQGVMSNGQELQVGQSLVSKDGRFRLVLQGDGNMVVYQGGTPLWASSTVGRGSSYAPMQGDGNLVIYTAAGHPVWASGTNGNPGAVLVMQSDGNLVIYTSTGTALWATNTCCH